jgi:hypothetical protein
MAELAQERRLAILVISHLRKQHGSAIHRSMGSLSFMTAARAAWVICEDPAGSDRRLMLPVKCNLASQAPGLAYTIVSIRADEATGDKPEHNASPTIGWSLEPINLSADDALLGRIRPRGRPKCERGEAARWLQTALAAGPRPSSDVEKEALANGFRRITLQRAFRDIDGKAIRVGYGVAGFWFWQLPTAGEEGPPPNLDDLWEKCLASDTL